MSFEILTVNWLKHLKLITSAKPVIGKNNEQMIFKQAPDLIDVEVIKSIYPEQGKLIVFLSCPDSLHGVKKYNPENDDKRYFIYGSYGTFFNINWKNVI